MLHRWFEGVNVYGSWFVSLKGWFEALVNDKKGQMLFLKFVSGLPQVMNVSHET